MALTLVRNVAGSKTTVASAEHMRTLGAYLRPLVAAGEADANVVRRSLRASAARTAGCCDADERIATPSALAPCKGAACRTPALIAVV